jgi:tRNA G46 methylase TrmB
VTATPQRWCRAYHPICPRSPIMSAVPTIYDEFEYPGQPRPQVHPRRLYTLGRLLGLAPPPVESARVLELGCGDGMHLLWIAEEFRAARCVGIDLAESGLARGRAAAAEI